MTKPLRIPSDDEFVAITIPAVDTTLYCGTHVYIPAHTIEVAKRYPTYEDGSLVADKTQKQVAEFMSAYKDFKGGLALYEDQFLRDTLGKDHGMFDENFGRNGQKWHWGYVLDYNKPSKEVIVDGINQQLVTRVIGYRLPDGDVELGVTTIAPSGMVPELTKTQMEKYFGKDSLTTLEKLGVAIPDNKKEAIKLVNTLGYPQFTLDHDYKEGGKSVSHSHHVYTPSQNDGERVGVRLALWLRHGGLWCFRVRLGRGPEDSDSYGSFPLVRGGQVEMEVTVPNPSRKVKF